MAEKVSEDMSSNERQQTVSSVALGTVEQDGVPSPAEKKAYEKFDKYLLPQLGLIIVLAYLDRTNIGNAAVFGLTEGLNLKGNQFGNLVTYFYITYIICDVFWVMCIKRFGANRVLGVEMVGWSIVTLSTGFVKTYKQALAVRLLLGLFEAGLLPSMIFLISTIWPRQGQSKRVGVIYCATTISGAFGGLIAYGIQSMGTKQGLASWRWLFIIEGTVSLFVGLVSLFSLPSSAEKAWFLTAEEAEAMRQKREREVLFKGHRKFGSKHIWMAVKDPLVYLTAIALFASSLPLLSFSTFLPSIILGLGYKSLQANYLTIPIYILATISVAVTTFFSDRINKKAIFLVSVPIPVLIGYAICVGTPNVGAGYFAMFLCGAGIYPYNCIMLAWLSGNLSPDYKRSFAIPLAASIANVSGVLSGQIYPKTDAPRYVSGNAIALGLEFLAFVSVFLISILLRWRMKNKAEALDRGEVSRGEGDKALEFRFQY